MNRLLLLAGTAVCALLFTACTPASAQEKKLTKNDVPRAVISSFEKKYPSATVHGYAKEVEKGKTYYEIEAKNGTSSLDVLFLPDGTIAEVEEGVAPAQLPAPVKQTVTAEYPDGKIATAEKTTRGKTVTYELTVSSDDAKNTLVLDPTGKILNKPRSTSKSPVTPNQEKKKD